MGHRDMDKYAADAERILSALFAIDAETESDNKIDYKVLYYKLFNGISLIIENTRGHEESIAALKKLQCMTEELYLEIGEESE